MKNIFYSNQNIFHKSVAMSLPERQSNALALLGLFLCVMEFSLCVSRKMFKFAVVRF